MFPASGVQPWQVKREDYNVDYRGVTIGNMVLDSSVGRDAERIRPHQADLGNIWCLGYWFGLQPVEESMGAWIKGTNETQCLYWATCQGLYMPEDGSSLPYSYEGGNPFPDEYVSADITSKMRRIWYVGQQRQDGTLVPQPNLRQADVDVVILGKQDHRGTTVLAHAIVKATSIKDHYIDKQIKHMQQMVESFGHEACPFPDLDGMYASKAGQGGPVSLHSLEVYTTDADYTIIGMFSYDLGEEE